MPCDPRPPERSGQFPDFTLGFAAKMQPAGRLRVKVQLIVRMEFLKYLAKIMHLLRYDFSNKTQKANASAFCPILSIVLVRNHNI